MNMVSQLSAEKEVFSNLKDSLSPKKGWKISEANGQVNGSKYNSMNRFDELKEKWIQKR